MIFLKWYSVIYMVITSICAIYKNLENEEFVLSFLIAILLLPIIVYLILS